MVLSNADLEVYISGAMMMAAFAMFFFMSIIPGGAASNTGVFAIYGRTKWVVGDILFSFVRWIAAVCGALGVWYLGFHDSTVLDSWYLPNVALAVTAALCMKASLASAANWVMPWFAAFWAFVSFAVGVTFVVLAFLDSDWLAGGLFIVYALWALGAFIVFLMAAINWRSTSRMIRNAVLVDAKWLNEAADLEEPRKGAKNPWLKSRNRGFGFKHNGAKHGHHHHNDGGHHHSWSPFHGARRSSNWD